MQEITINFERKLRLRNGATILDGVMSVGPIEEDGNGMWICKYRISYIVDGGAVSRGMDPLDAFSRCLRSMRFLIEKSASDGQAVAWWIDEGDLCGL